VLIRAYLDAPDSNQTLSELKDSFETFARKKGHRIGIFYNEQQVPAARSSLFRLLRSKGLAIASQDPPASQNSHHPTEELFRLLGQARPNDVVLIKSIRLLGRLSTVDWQRFRQKAKEKKVRIVAMDVAASWAMITSESAMAPMAEQLTGMMLDMLETLVLTGNSAHRNRHLEGIAKAKAQGKYRGRPVNRKKHEAIHSLLQQGYSWSEVCAKTGASRSTVARVVKSET
jgi:DNA invertase Pin-like site-specific DNA recombinase